MRCLKLRRMNKIVREKILLGLSQQMRGCAWFWVSMQDTSPRPESNGIRSNYWILELKMNHVMNMS